MTSGRSHPRHDVDTVRSLLDAMARNDKAEIERSWSTLEAWGLDHPHLRSIMSGASRGCHISAFGKLFAVEYRVVGTWIRLAVDVFSYLEEMYGSHDGCVLVVPLNGAGRLAFNDHAMEGLHVVGIGEEDLCGPSAQSILAHELTHCFFRSGCRFLDEGIAVVNHTLFPPASAAFATEDEEGEIMAAHAPLRRSLAAMMLVPAGDALFASVSNNPRQRKFSYLYAARLVEEMQLRVGSSSLKAAYDTCLPGSASIHFIEQVFSAPVADIESDLFGERFPTPLPPPDLYDRAMAAFVDFSSSGRLASHTYNLLFDSSVRGGAVALQHLCARWLAFRIFHALPRGGGVSAWLGDSAAYLKSLLSPNAPEWHLLDAAIHMISLTQPTLLEFDDHGTESPSASALASLSRASAMAPSDTYLRRALDDFEQHVRRP
ncbi:MAG: hypothetical protein ACI8U3_002520 [Brevundimonas sp.]|jgi:hypothetical protein